MTNVTIGIDLGDKNHEVCVLDNAGEVIERFMVGNTKIQIQSFLVIKKKLYSFE